MSDFNPLQMITRIATNIASGSAIQNNVANSTQNALNSTFNTFNNNFQNNSENNNAPLVFKSTPLTLSLASELKLTTIEVEKKADYVKDLLNLPRDFSELINQITTGNNPSSVLNSKLADILPMVLMSDGRVDLSKLSEFLSENSKSAMQKLMMTIANVSKYGANDVSNLKELMGLFSVNSNMASDTQALKTLLLLYLPWLPLAQRNENDLDFTIDIFDKIQGPDPESEENIETVKILIQTENFSNVIAMLETNSLGQIDIDIVAGDNFPHKRVMEIIKEESSINNVKSNISSSVSKKADEEDIQKLASNNVKIMAAGAISPKLMLMTQLLIKIVIKVDYEQTIIKQQDEDNKNEGEV